MSHAEAQRKEGGNYFRCMRRDGGKEGVRAEAKPRQSERTEDNLEVRSKMGELMK